MGLFRVSSQSDRERLLAAGFTEQRIDWINRRSDELRMEALKAQYDTQRGEPRTLPAIALRNEMGDAEYERYLGALLGGGPTTVGVRQVLATSPAEQAGLQAGDEIVAYDGRRVATMAELNALSRDGKASESVVVEIRRNGQSMHLVVSRGPLGVSGSGLPALGP
jgi:predicted metalloprotease with PDZ domain